MAIPFYAMPPTAAPSSLHMSVVQLDGQRIPPFSNKATRQKSLGTFPKMVCCWGVQDKSNLTISNIKGNITPQNHQSWKHRSLILYQAKLYDHTANH